MKLELRYRDMSHAVHEVPRPSRAQRHAIFDHLPVHHVPEGFTAPEPIVHDPHDDHHHHHEDHSEQNQQIKEILGDSPDLIAYRKFEAALERTAAPIWDLLGKLGIHVY